MTEVDVSLLIAAALVSALSLRNPRGVLWIGIAALSYINGDIAWRLNLPYAEAVTGMGDAAVCLCVYFWGQQKWEMWIWRLFQASVAASMLYLAGNLGIFLSIPHEVYSILMEAVNWLLLLMVGGVAAVQFIRSSNVGAVRSWRNVHNFALAIRGQRKRASFLDADH